MHRLPVLAGLRQASARITQKSLIVDQPFKARIASSELSAGYAIDDRAGIILEKGQATGYITARPNAAAYFIRQDTANTETMTLDEVRNIPL